MSICYEPLLPWSPEEAAKIQARANQQFREKCECGICARFGPDNCRVCCLKGRLPIHQDQTGGGCSPRVSGWSRLWVESQREIPSSFWQAFKEEWEDNEPYLEGLLRSILTWSTNVPERHWPRTIRSRIVCPNCGQWANAGPKGYFDCLHDCAEHNMTKQVRCLQWAPSVAPALDPKEKAEKELGKCILALDTLLWDVEKHGRDVVEWQDLLEMLQRIETPLRTLLGFEPAPERVVEEAEE